MLQKIPVEINTQEWLELRQNYIGCSEIPVLTGAVTSYASPLNIFYEKIGLSTPSNQMKELPFMGHLHEPMILDLWEYYENGQREKYVDNFMAKRKIRNLIRNTGYILVNSDIPFLSLTPDGIIPAGELSLYGEKLEKEAPVNAKNINSLKWHQFDGYIPEHRQQMHGEMLVFGTQYSEIASLVGGNEFHVAHCEFDEGISKAILGICSKFWHDRVLPARPLAARYKTTHAKADKEAIMADIMQLEPMPDETDSYRAFLSARFQDRENPEKIIKASDSMQKLMKIHQYYSDVEKVIKSKKTLIKNTLLKVHEHNSITLIQGEGVKSTMNKKHVISGGEYSTAIIKEQVNKLNPNICQ